MKAVSLFSGAGGADLGLHAAGIETVAMCENAPHARAVLRYRFPGIPLHDDVTTFDGTQYKGVDLVSGGSPCQDLSVAGKREGIQGLRSSLFFHQVRIWHETEAPYLKWENVYGALSSQSGADFALVLSTLVGAAVAVPADGWPRGGVVAGPTAVAAWYVFNLEHFGVPQSRDRVVVLAARAGGVDPAEVLAIRPRVRGDTAPRFEARENAAALAGSGTGESRGGGQAININDSQARLSDVAHAIAAQKGAGSAMQIGAQCVAVLAERERERERDKK